MIEYNKINTLFKRDMTQKHSPIIYGDYCQPEYEYLANNTWIGTEKIDGTNIRIKYLNGEVFFAGRTDAASIPPRLQEYLSKTFTIEKLNSVFGDTDVCLYGEGFGNKIQGCGSKYISNDNSFILFDIKIGQYWLKRDDLEGICKKLDIAIVPILFSGTIKEAIYIVKQGFNSTISESPLIAEGLILKPNVDLFDRMGKRIITKIKHKDFKDIQI